MESSSSDSTKLRLSAVDVDLILRALQVYDHQVSLMNLGIFPISEDELSDLNNDAEYMQGLRKHLEVYRDALKAAR
jgi:hypothetical protein